jgi:hypothetical protein
MIFHAHGECLWLGNADRAADDLSESEGAMTSVIALGPAFWQNELEFYE